MYKMKNVINVDPEFKALMPLLTDEEYAQLEQNILARHQVNDPVLTWSSLIVDGYHRFCICMAHGIRFEVRELNFASREEVKVWMLENQLGRRNLNDAQRIELALCKEEVLREKAKERQAQAGGDRKSEKSLPPKKTNSSNEHGEVRDFIAKDANVSHGTVQNYKQIKNSGDADLLQKVLSGELKIGTAFRLLEPELNRQLDKVDEMLAYIKEYLPRIKKENDCPLNEKLILLTEQLGGLLSC